MNLEEKRLEEALEWDGTLLSRRGPTLTTTCGLRNCGNTCYMNSVLQAMAHVPPLAGVMECDWQSVTSPGSGAPAADEKRREFCDHFAATIQKMWSGEFKDFGPRKLISSTIAMVPEFDLGGQQDAHEALNYILNNLHDDAYVPMAKERHPARRALMLLEEERLKLDEESKNRATVNAALQNGKKKIIVPPLIAALPATAALSQEERLENDKKRELENRVGLAYEPYQKSIVNDVFRVLMTQRVTCSCCDSTSLTVQEDFALCVALPSKSQMKSMGPEKTSSGSKIKSPTSSSLNGNTPSKSSSLTSTNPRQTMSSDDYDTNASPARENNTSPSGNGLFSGFFGSLKGAALSLVGGPTHTLNLEDCLKSFFTADELKGDEQYRCERCNTKVDASRTTELAFLPEILSVELKRFNKSRGAFGLGSQKNSTIVRYPLQGLDLRPYCGSASYAAGYLTDPSSALYDLIGVIRHSGNTNGGHYIATCKSRMDGRWYEIDDEFVNPITNAEELQSPDAYLLFYAKRQTESDTLKKSQALKVLVPKSSVAEEEAVNGDVKMATGESSSRALEKRYVSLAWALKFETMSNPGPLDNSYFECEHGRVAWPAASDVTNRVVAVRLDAFETLKQLYGLESKTAECASLDSCPECKEAHMALQARRDDEYRIVAESNKNPLKLWYVVPNAWVRKWIAFVKNDCGPLGRGPWLGSQPPGPIDTGSLLEKDKETIKPNLKLDSHYRCVNRVVWKAWLDIYGCSGPVLPRSESDLYSDPIDDSRVVDEQVAAAVNGSEDETICDGLVANSSIELMSEEMTSASALQERRA